MGNKSVTLILTSLTIVGAGLFLSFTLCPRLPRLNTAPHEGLGEVVAQEAVKLLGSGGRVILITRDTATFLNPAADAQIKSFAQTLKRSGIRIGTTNLLKLDPLRVVSVPPGEFFQILRRASDTDVIVSFLGPPALSDDQIVTFGDKPPKIVAVCSGEMPAQVNLKRLFEKKLLQAAVISRRTVTPTPPASNRPKDWFDYLFAVVTPANLPDLPGSVPASR